MLFEQPCWSVKLGISSDGAILVRPDGFVAWRTSHLETLAAPPQTTLGQVLSQILCRSPNSNRTAAIAAAGAVQGRSKGGPRAAVTPEDSVELLSFGPTARNSSTDQT